MCFRVCLVCKSVRKSVVKTMWWSHATNMSKKYFSMARIVCALMATEAAKLYILFTVWKHNVSMYALPHVKKENICV